MGNREQRIGMNSFKIILTCTLAVLLVSCEKNNLGMIDTSKEVPQLSNASVTPDSIYLDNLTPIGGQYQIAATIRVTSTIASTVSQTVTATIYRPNSSSEFQHLTLVPASGGYSGQIQFTASRAQAGRYRVRFSSQNEGGLQSNAVELPLKLGRRNSRPVLSNLNAPTTAEIPNRPQDSVNVVFAVTASDSDGLSDIRLVRLNPTQFVLIDDGSLGPPNAFRDPNNIVVTRRSGDAAAGDGIYSITIPLLFSSSVDTARTDTYQFQATDSFGDTSATIVHQITLRRRR